MGRLRLLYYLTRVIVIIKIISPPSGGGPFTLPSPLPLPPAYLSICLPGLCLVLAVNGIKPGSSHMQIPSVITVLSPPPCSGILRKPISIKTYNILICTDVISAFRWKGALISSLGTGQRELKKE